MARLPQKRPVRGKAPAPLPQQPRRLPRGKKSEGFLKLLDPKTMRKPSPKRPPSRPGKPVNRPLPNPGKPPLGKALPFNDKPKTGLPKAGKMYGIDPKTGKRIIGRVGKPTIGPAPDTKAKRRPMQGARKTLGRALRKGIPR